MALLRRSIVEGVPSLRQRAPIPMATPDLGSVVESCKRELEWLLRTHQGRPLPRCWSDQPYGEEPTRLEEEVLPALAGFLERLAQIDAGIEAAWEADCARIQVVEHPAGVPQSLAA
jgi:hypothetical protein